MSCKGPVILVSSRSLKLQGQTCLCLDSSENKQTSEGTRKRKLFSTKAINQLFLLLCVLVLRVEPIAGSVWHQWQWLGHLQSQPGAAGGGRDGMPGMGEAWGTQRQHQSPVSQSNLSDNYNHHLGYILSNLIILMNEIALVSTAAC